MKKSAPLESLRTIRYGASELEVGLSRGAFVGRLEPSSSRPMMSAEEIIRQALGNPVGSPRLREIARGKSSAAILISGKDRVACADVYLPVLLEELNDAGVPDDGIEIYLATGTHEKHSPEEAGLLMGREVSSRIRWREHDCRNEQELRRVGVTSYGTEVFIHSGVLEAGVKVLTGRIIPHYFAGFSGGRKALVPGVAGFMTICQNHRLTLDPGRGIHPNVRPCCLAGNPVHLDMLEAASLVEPLFALNTILDTSHNLIGAFAGDVELSHEAGCARAAEIFKTELKEPLDAVITSAGGRPYDCNFMQALKAVFDVQEIVRPGGAILWIAECPGGMKKEFPRWGRIKSDEALENSVRSDYDLAGHNTVMLRKLTGRVRVALLSALADEEVSTMGLQPVHSLQEGLEWLIDGFRGNFRYAVVPFGNVTYATVGR